MENPQPLHHRLTEHKNLAPRRIDFNKKVKGRKEHFVVDTQGLLVAVTVHKANIYDSNKALLLIGRVVNKLPFLKRAL